MVSFHSGKPSGITGSEFSSWAIKIMLGINLYQQTHVWELRREKRWETWKRVFDGRGPILQKYRHLRSGPTGVWGWCSLGIAFSFSCISSSTKLLGTSTFSGVTPTYDLQSDRHFSLVFFKKSIGHEYYQMTHNFSLYNEAFQIGLSSTYNTWNSLAQVALFQDKVLGSLDDCVLSLSHPLSQYLCLLCNHIYIWNSLN